MKTTVRKAVAASLALSVSLSFAACSKKTGESGIGSEEVSHSGTKIASDSPWYSSDIIEVNPVIDKNRELESLYSRYAGSDDNYIVVMTNGYYKIPNDYDWNNFNNSDFAIYTATVLDRATKQVVNTIDLNELLSLETYIDSVKYRDGRIMAVSVNYDSTNDIATYTETYIDPAGGYVLDARQVPEVIVENTFDLGSYRIDTELVWDEISYYNLHVHAPDGTERIIELSDPEKGIYDISVILPLTDTTVMIPAGGEGGKSYYEIDLKGGTVTPVDEKDYEWLTLDYMSSIYYGSDCKLYYLTNTGIKFIDMKNKTAGTSFDFSWCGVNRSKLSDLEIAEYDDGKVLLCGEIYKSNRYSNSDYNTFTIVEFTKSQNPHAGKTILELYSPYGFVDSEIGDAILKYNETNSNFYIEVTDRYNSGDFYDENQRIDSEDDYESYNLNGNSKLSNDLALDLINGDGPDILMNCSAYGQLNNQNYLADLTPYIGTLDPDKYFTNIVEGSMVDGRLYHLPVSYKVDGIQTAPQYAGASGVGFTTEEYEKFLNEVLNGEDVIPVGQAYYFARLFSVMSDKFIVDGKADFSAPEFAVLAGFVKDNVPESAKSWSDAEFYEDYYYDGVSGDQPFQPVVESSPVKGDRIPDGNSRADYVTCNGMAGYLINLSYGRDNTAILGIPSADGRGPMFENDISVAISAHAENIEACGEFIKLLLSDEVQQEVAMNDKFVLSRDAFRQSAAKAVEFYNGEGGYNIFGYDAETGRPANNGLVFSDKNITDMENNILNCSRIYSPDGTVNLILIEEMPAYFMGQKNLEDVIVIAQDRVQKVLDERG